MTDIPRNFIGAPGGVDEKTKKELLLISAPLDVCKVAPYVVSHTHPGNLGVLLKEMQAHLEALTNAHNILVEHIKEMTFHESEELSKSDPAYTIKDITTPGTEAAKWAEGGFLEHDAAADQHYDDISRGKVEVLKPIDGHDLNQEIRDVQSGKKTIHVIEHPANVIEIPVVKTLADYCSCVAPKSTYPVFSATAPGLTVTMCNECHKPVAPGKDD